MNYQPVTAGNQTNKNTGPQETNGDTGLKKNVDDGQTEKENVSTQQYILFPLWSSICSSYKSSDEKDGDDTANDVAGKATRVSSTNSVNTVSTPVNAANASRTFGAAGPSFVEAIQEELLQFKIQKVWTLVDLPYGKKAIGTKWVYRNKKDAIGIMDVKSTFLYDTIKEEVYVCQPPGFVYPEFLEKVYKVEKALYGLHQAPRAWYETLSNYLLDNGFHRGQIDKTLFIKRVKGDILL
ncbi:putative ribonuclease H-like domain-containing protein, partial [Tanacetum coccineum]